MNIDDLANLPWQTQIAISGGFLGYRMASIGRRYNHQTIDILLFTILFSLPATITYNYLASDLGDIASAIAAVFATIILGLAWRSIGSNLWLEIMRDMNISWEDGSPTAWMSAIERAQHGPTQLIVELKNGETLVSDNLSRFRNAPYGPCLWGPDGSIALYVTSRIGKSGDKVDIDHAPNVDWGELITFVPANQIASTQVRLTRS